MLTRCRTNAAIFLLAEPDDAKEMFVASRDVRHTSAVHALLGDRVAVEEIEAFPSTCELHREPPGA